MATCFPLLLLQLGKSRTNFQQPPIVSEFVNAALSMKAICIISLVAISTQRKYLVNNVSGQYIGHPYIQFTTAKRMEQHRKWYFMYADEFNRICFIMSVLAPISFLLDQMIASVWTAIKPVCGIADHLFYFSVWTPCCSLSVEKVQLCLNFYLDCEKVRVPGESQIL